MRGMCGLRLAARSLWRTPAFTGVVVLILGLGIGANATLFSIADAVVFRPFPFVDQQRLVIAGEDASEPRSEISYRDYLYWRANLETFEDLGVIGSTNWTLHLRLRDGLMAIPHRSVSANFFEIVGAKPYLGRPFDASDDRRGAARTLILGYGFWQRQFGGDSRVVGQVLESTEGAFTVVGVMPPDFRYPAGTDAWTPVVADLAAVPPNAVFDKLEDSDVGVLFAIGRLKPQATLAAARTDLSRVIDRASRAIPRGRRVGARLTPLVDDILGSARLGMWMLIGAVSVLLLAACANVAGLLLARSADRRHEFAVRMALGASRWAVMRQLFCESVLLTMAATVAAALAAIAGVPVVRAWIPDGLPRLGDAGVNVETLLFTAAIGCAAAVLSWIAPAFQSARNLEPALRRSGHTIVAGGLRQPLRRALIVGELAAAVVLLTAAGLMLRSVVSLARLDLGFDAHQLLAVKLSPPSSTATAAGMRTLAERAIAELAAIPGVAAAAGVSNRPLLGPIGSDSPIRLEGQSVEAAGRNPFVNIETTTPEYLTTMRGQLRQGRFFTHGDRATTEAVVVVSEGFAARAWPGMPAIGKRLQVTALNRARPPGPVWWTVVGVVGDSRNRQITAAAFDVYVPLAQSPDRIDTLVVRTAASSDAVAPIIRQRLRSLNGDGVVSIEAMEDVVSQHEARWHANLALFGAFAILTLVIAVTGLYAMMAHAVVEQSREIGVRLVLGATPGGVAGSVIAGVLPIVAAGAVTGLAGAVLTGRLMRSLLFGIEPLDPVALLVSPLLLAVIAVAACVLPAMRAARTDPAVCLRAE
jgi:putative ABC transport system permease protein